VKTLSLSARYKKAKTAIILPEQLLFLTWIETSVDAYELELVSRGIPRLSWRFLHNIAPPSARFLVFSLSVIS